MPNIGGGRDESRCDHCGQTDDHPKAMIGDLATGTVSSKHFDCLSFDDKALHIGAGQEKGSPKNSAVIEACEGGKRGADLLALIESGDLAKSTGNGGRTFDTEEN